MVSAPRDSEAFGSGNLSLINLFDSKFLCFTSTLTRHHHFFKINNKPNFSFILYWAKRDLKVLLTFLLSKLSNSRLLTDKMLGLLFCYSSWILPQWENLSHSVNVLTLWIHCTAWNSMFSSQWYTDNIRVQWCLIHFLFHWM